MSRQNGRNFFDGFGFRKSNKLGDFFILLLIVLVLSLLADAADAAGFSAAPLSKEYEAYVREMRSARGEGESRVKRGYSPRPVDLSHLKPSDYEAYLSGSRARGAMPARYDLREKGFVTPAKNQTYNNCWSYSALGSVESTYLKRTGLALDLSEMHLSWFAYNGTYVFDGGIDNGGYDNVAVAVLSRWTGAVTEASCPETAIPQYAASHYRNRLHLEDAYFLALQYVLDVDQPTSDIRKQLVYEHGAVSVGMYAGSEAKYYNPATASYYYNDETATRANHAVLLCGWDDDYPRENFRQDNRPSKNGAWLIKNSWGTDYGDAGFFWISYEDLGFSDGTAFLVGEADNYDYNYGYDQLGWCNMLGADTGRGETGWFANIFTCSMSGSENNEILKAVSFYTVANNASYEIYVYTGLTDKTNPRSGTLALGPQRGSELFAGYHTVSLDEALELAPGTTFSVVVKMTTPGYYYPIPVEMSVGTPLGDGTAYPYSSKAVIEKGVSFAAIDGAEWEDVAEYDVNVCLKAFTAKGQAATPPTPTPPADNNKGSGGGGCDVGVLRFAVLLAVGVVIRRRK